ELRPLAGDEGWADLNLAVENIEHSSDGHLRIRALGRVDNQVAGFWTSVPQILPLGLVRDKNGTISSAAVVPGGFILERSGPESDLFVQVLAGVWGLERKGLRMRDRTNPTVINLSDVEGRIEIELVHAKL